MRNDAHTALVREALEKLALGGITAWQVNTGAHKTQSGGYIKYGKTGAADICAIIPRKIGKVIIGQHCEFEAKTGMRAETQSEKNKSDRKNQRLHQQFVVERNGGL